MLKQFKKRLSKVRLPPAAFRRLCVETMCRQCLWQIRFQPPSGGCVLKHYSAKIKRVWLVQPPSGGCVLKQNVRPNFQTTTSPSRLQAAVC